MESFPRLRSSRIWITGGHGFVGRHLLSFLQQAGCSMIYAPTHRECDLLDPTAVERTLKNFHPDIIIHLAARVGGIGANLKHPAEYFYENVMMGIPLMHQAYLYGVKKFVAVGTICAYPKFAPPPFREENLWDGYPEETNAPYGLAKKMLLVQAQAYRQQYGWNAIYLLPVNMYGPGDNFDLETSHVIPALLRKFLEAKEQGQSEVVCWGDGSPSREFIYVADVVRGLALAAEHYDSPEPVNLGTGKEIAIRDLAEKIRTLVGYEGKIVWDPSRPNGQPRRCLDVSRAERYFGFRAEISLEEGLQRTLDWYHSYRSMSKKRAEEKRDSTP